jgi:capsular polysaccharide export protein
MRYFKLGSVELSSFPDALPGQVTTLDVSVTAAVRHLWQSKGGKGVWRALRKNRAEAAPLIEGNIMRKHARLPLTAMLPGLTPLYRWIKTVQAAVLLEAMRQKMVAADRPVALIFNGSNYPESVLAQAAADTGCARIFVEGGYFTGTLQIDGKGLNAMNSVPRDAEFYLSSGQDFTANGMPETLNTRTNKRTATAAKNIDPGYVFVPFQVPSDMQVTLHSPWIRSMEQFLDVVLSAADRNPDDVFVIKEHPTFRRSVVGKRPDHPRVIFANDNVTSELIENARTVLTLNSTVGIEALSLGKPVITLGAACYVIEGLVQPACDNSSLDAALNKTHDWLPDETLRSQFLGYLWGHYLTHGSYKKPPAELGALVESIATKVGSPAN